MVGHLDDLRWNARRVRTNRERKRGGFGAGNLADKTRKEMRVVTDVHSCAQNEFSGADKFAYRDFNDGNPGDLAVCGDFRIRQQFAGSQDWQAQRIVEIHTSSPD